jgi:hypothetical protein
MWGIMSGQPRIEATAEQRAESRGLARSSGQEEVDWARAILLSLDQRSDCILRAARQLAPLHWRWIFGREGGLAARSHGSRRRSGEGAGWLVGDRGSIAAGGVGAAELDAAAPGPTRSGSALASASQNRGSAWS